MKFVCLGYFDEAKWSELSQGEQDVLVKQCLDYDDQLRGGQHFMSGEALGSAASGVTLRKSLDGVTVYNGPYAETKEVLGGILLLEARDLNHAISLISQHPGLQMGPFEIRPSDVQTNARIAERAAEFAKVSATSVDFGKADFQWAAPQDGRPAIVSRAEWEDSLAELLALEKAATRARDAIAAHRRRLPMVKLDIDYTFQGPDGAVHLRDLFEGRKQLAIYHFMFAEGVGGWPTAGCVGCSLLVDNIGHSSHFNARDLTLALVSRGPLDRLNAYKERMGWSLPWYSSANSSFNEDFGVSTPQGETHGLSVFLRDEDNVYLTYRCGERGVETLLSNFTLLDMTPFGRQELWEDSPHGWPQSEPYSWWKRHDEYSSPQLVSIAPSISTIQ